VKPLLYLLAALAGVLLLLAGLIFGPDIAEPLVPNPESVSRAFVDALAAGRYEIARQELSDELKAGLTVEELRRLNEALRQAHGDYEAEPGGQTEKRGDRATYQAQLQTDSGQILHPQFTLERDPRTGQYQIDAVEGLAP
jgi:hypothetical protein